MKLADEPSDEQQGETMDHLYINEIGLTDAELAHVSGGAIPVVAGAVLVGIGMLAGYGAVRLVEEITTTGTLNAGLQKH